MAEKKLKIIGSDLSGNPVYEADPNYPVPEADCDVIVLDESGKEFVQAYDYKEEGFYYPLNKDGSIDRTKPTRL